MSSTPQNTRFLSVDYEHPKLVDSLRQGWILSYQAIAVVAALFAAMEASIITLTKAQEPDGHPPLRFSSSSYQNAVLGLAYVALILNVGSIVSALKIIDAIGRIAYRNAVKEPRPEPDVGWPIQGPDALMRTYGVKGRVRLLMWHSFYCLLLGSLCVLTQIIMYIWLHEAMSIVWASVAATIVAAVPIFTLLD
ncbi:hypothetical protein M407DRAFT_33476 [Tulasnella calospora MUT 4182]|uniref:Uncharacterized protein n=1 Tax=Tulasnella calospora MUT 4182 TaxID=1051891 RepID=A0A0C3L5V3_9AGAM|nr:hypothetical protein M407DRAFT_33476 [Tulasnella calospora MUT 4182]